MKIERKSGAPSSSKFNYVTSNNAPYDMNNDKLLINRETKQVVFAIAKKLPLKKYIYI